MISRPIFSLYKTYLRSLVPSLTVLLAILCTPSTRVQSAVGAQSIVHNHSRYNSRSFYQRPFTVMINPAGNAQSTERVINKSFERSIALNAAEELQHHLSQELSGIHVLISRSPGQATSSLHNAQCANSLGIDLFISLHFYHERHVKPHVYIYQFSYNNQLRPQPSDFTFYRCHQSYFFNHRSSLHAGNILAQVWARAPYAQQFITHAVTGFPCAPLLGIIVPALALDIGIKEPRDWHEYIPALVEGIKEIASNTSAHTTLRATTHTTHTTAHAPNRRTPSIS